MTAKKQKTKDEPPKAWSKLMTWVGGATALIGLFASLGGGVTWLMRKHELAMQYKSKMSLAEVQARQGDDQATLQTYGEILKEDPSYEPALDAQVKAAELWAEKIDVTMASEAGEAQLAAAQKAQVKSSDSDDSDNGEEASREQGDATDAAAAAMLDKIMPVLEAGLTRAQGAQAAEITAHIGWVHWLNKHVAERESGDADEQSERAAVALDANNVYANAMLAYVMIQHDESLADAMHHFEIALGTGRETALVRKLEVDGLLYAKEPGGRGQLVKVANEMRKSGQPIDDYYRWRIVDWCFNPGQTEYDKLTESYSAVPPGDVVQTFQWLYDPRRGAGDPHFELEFMQASLLDVGGNEAGALDKFRALDFELKNTDGVMKDQVEEQIARLSHQPATGRKFEVETLSVSH